MTTLVLFLRWPEPGRVKTRLIPALGADGACALYERLAKRACAEIDAFEYPQLSRWAFVTPAEHASDWTARLGPRWTAVGQPEATLGQRLQYVIALAFSTGATRVFVAGSDVPELDREVWSEAFSALDTHDAVVGPALDGGYYLLGLRREMPELFAGIDWSTDQVLAQTCAALQRASTSHLLLRPLRDLDTPDDLAAFYPGSRP